MKMSYNIEVFLKLRKVNGPEMNVWISACFYIRIKEHSEI